MNWQKQGLVMMMAMVVVVVMMLVAKNNRKLNLAWKLCTYSWIRRQQRADKKQFANKPERLRQFRDHQWKALGKENLDFLGSIFVVNF